MIEKQPKRVPDARKGQALDTWEGEGGGAAQVFPQDLVQGVDQLAASERHILECLGAAVVVEWNALPTDVQRAIFRHAAAGGEAYDPTELKVRIARFLHDHKNDAAAR